MCGLRFSRVFCFCTLPSSPFLFGNFLHINRKAVSLFDLINNVGHGHFIMKSVYSKTLRKGEHGPTGNVVT